MAHLIEMRKVSKYYSNGDSVSAGFSKVDLNLDAGEFVVITGESGGGKSTLLNVISGLDSFEEGEMKIDGKDMGAFRGKELENYRKTYVANIFQDYNLINSYSAYQNIELMMLMNGNKKRKVKYGVLGILRWLGLRDYAKTKVSKLSGGQKQRVAIARAFAKDAPIIVADEPTGNLDTKAAKNVMETLYKISKGKLVVIVTHNYEDVEPYATRKIIMRDGRIVEDVRLRPAHIIPPPHVQDEKTKDNLNQSNELNTQKTGRVGRKDKSKKSQDIIFAKENKDVRLGSVVRLGIRNTFNIPAKFLLLLLIFLFISSAVLSIFSSMMTKEHQRSLQGFSEYFSDTSPERVILKKNDKSSFTNEDFEKIQGISNVKNIIKNDLALDKTISLESETMFVEGPVYNTNQIKNSDLKFGRLPENQNEIVLGIDELANAYYLIEEEREKLIGKSYYLTFLDQNTGEGGRIAENKATIVGVTTKKAENDLINQYGYSRFYVTDDLSNALLISNVALSTDIMFGMELNNINKNRGKIVIASDRVPQGYVYLNKDDAANNYKYEKAIGKKFTIKAKNRFFEAEGKYKIKNVVEANNINKLLGYNKEQFDEFSQCVFVNPTDYKSLFDKGNFQISVYLSDEKLSGETIKALDNAGYKTLSMKNVIGTEGSTIILIQKFIDRTIFGIMLTVLFFISYAVIRLIMRSRNSYYSTIRMLGGKKSVLRRMLWIELFTVIIIASSMVVTFVALVKQGVIQVPELKDSLSYVKNEYYIALFGIMTLMSYLIAGRYSRKIFSKTAMNSYREGGLS